MSEKDTEAQSGSRAHPSVGSSKADLPWAGLGSRELLKFQQRAPTKAWRKEEGRRGSFPWELWALKLLGEGVNGRWGHRRPLKACTSVGRYNRDN